MIHIAVIGLGAIGNRHVDEVRINTACILTAVADPSMAAAQGAAEMGLEQAYSRPCFISKLA